MEKEKRERKERKRKSAVFRHSDVSRWRLGIHQRQPVVKSYRARDELLAIAVVTAHGNHSDRKKQNQATKPNKIKLYSKCFLKWPDNKQPKTRTQTSPIIYLFIVLFLNCRNKVSTPFPLHFQLFALSDLKIVSAPGVSRWGGGRCATCEEMAALSGARCIVRFIFSRAFSYWSERFLPATRSTLLRWKTCNRWMQSKVLRSRSSAVNTKEERQKVK